MRERNQISRFKKKPKEEGRGEEGGDPQILEVKIKLNHHAIH